MTASRSGAAHSNGAADPNDDDAADPDDDDAADPDDAALALRVAHLTKSFTGTQALDDVSLDMRRGEVHALLGGNGSGKSTLIKILAGVCPGEPGGTVAVGATELGADQITPATARALGLRFVHQNPAVFAQLSVAENLAIGHGFPTTRAGSIAWRALHARSRQILDRFGIAAAPEQLVGSLRPAERTMIAIARALQDQEDEHSGVLVLDEPTTALPRDEVNRLLDALARYARQGQAILFVSHRLDEVIAAADRATVLRDGRVAGVATSEEITEPRLIELITGRPIDQQRVWSRSVARSGHVLEAVHLSGGPLVDVSFQLHPGEMLGIAGLLGSGRSELLKMIFGALAVRGGEIRIDGHPVRFGHIGEAMAAGIAYVPEDRGVEASFAALTVTENLTAATLRRYWSRWRLQHRRARTEATEAVSEFLIRASSVDQPMATLSGGNQQKVILARWLRRRPRILLLDEPTQGVDVQARTEIYDLVRDAVAAGSAAIIVTSDFEELATVCDRVVVLGAGRVVGELERPHIDAARLTELSFCTEEVAP